jgi:phosphoribosylformylglycinamidine synthase
LRFGIVVFPGSNCDYDCYWALKHRLEYPVTFLWHRQRILDSVDCIVLPGGFSYGDYLRAGAIARFSPIMDSVVQHAAKGKPVIGICNGFQVLTEIGLLPGALLKNDNLRFIHKPVYLRVEHSQSPFTAFYPTREVIELPIAHGQGKYHAPPDVITQLEERKQILFRYCGPHGGVDDSFNPNGSLHSVAGICNEKGNVLGMMPHPERRMHPRLGGTDGQAIFQGIAESFH